MSFSVDLLIDKKIKDAWGGEDTLKYTRLKYHIEIGRRKGKNQIDELYILHENLEAFKHKEDNWVKENINPDTVYNWRPKVSTGKRGKPYIYTNKKNGIITINLPQDGKRGGKETRADATSRSVLSGIDDVNFPHAFAAKEEMKNWKFLQLNPDALREPTKKQLGMSDEITQKGENLAAALFRIKLEDEYRLKEISRKINGFCQIS